MKKPKIPYWSLLLLLSVLSISILTPILPSHRSWQYTPPANDRLSLTGTVIYKKWYEAKFAAFADGQDTEHLKALVVGGNGEVVLKIGQKYFFFTMVIEADYAKAELGKSATITFDRSNDPLLISSEEANLWAEGSE